MQDVMLAVALLIFICLGFPVMKRLDRYLDEHYRYVDEDESDENKQTGKQNKNML